MEKFCKKCSSSQKVEILYEKRYTQMQRTIRVVECKTCKDRFLDIEKGSIQLELFKTP